MDTDPTVRKSDLHTRVTLEIIRAIEAGETEYEMPWHRKAGGGFPRNAATGNAYHGVNTLSLWAAGECAGYALPYWATFRQWTALGAQVRRGEHAARVVFYCPETPPRADEAAEKGHRWRPVLRASFVFNAAQVDGWEAPQVEEVDRTERLQRVDQFIESLGAEILYGGDQAGYSHRLDRIYMPRREAFVDRKSCSATEGFYSVLLHEHIHWSGSQSRLNRDLSGRFGDHAYAMEELIAELGAAFLCAELGIGVQPRRDHAGYVADWLAVLRQQKSAIFTAASAATTACRYLSGVASAAAE